MNKMEFLQGFLRSPREVGSIIPSSKFLVQKIIDCVEKEKPKTCVELGAGTGVFTRELTKVLQNGTFVVFEKDDQLREQLNKDFPHLPIHVDAMFLPDILDDMGIDQVDCIVCGLPFTLFPKEKTEQIFHHIHTRLKDDGMFMMYQYSTHMKNRLKQLFGDVSIEFVAFNIPPAFVYFCKKKINKRSAFDSAKTP